MKKLLLFLLTLVMNVGAWADVVTYTITSTSAVSTSGTAPQGSSAVFSQTYSSKCQMTSGNKMTLTLRGYASKKITGITLSMKSNSSAGAGYFEMKAGTTTLASIGTTSSGVAFNKSQWNGAYTTTYTNVTPTMSDNDHIIGSGENVVIVIGATANSLYCQSFKITYEDTNAPTLKSIAIKTAPTKTTYMEGETFNPTGLVITKTLSDDNTEDVEYNNDTKESFTFNPALTKELKDETSVSITYDGKTTNQSITVTPFVATPGTYSINLNNSFYGIGIGNNGTEQSAIAKGVTVVSGCKSSATTKTYYDESHIRYYIDSYLKLTAPIGYAITKVVFTAGGTWNGSITANTGSYGNSNKTWTGTATQLDFSMAAQNRIASMAVTYVPATTIGAAGYGTYFDGEHDIYVPNGLTVYVAYYNNGDLTLDKAYEYGDVIPAGEPVIIKGEAGAYAMEYDTRNIAKPSYKSRDLNDLCGTDVEATTTVDADGDYYFYALSLNSKGEANSVGFYWRNNDGAAFTCPAHKAYLALPKALFSNPARATGFAFNKNTTTGISEINTSTTHSNVIFNLAGQRVNANAKGIVIMNGKKFVK